VGRPQAEQSAVAGRRAHRAAGVGAEGEVAQPVRHRGGRTARRAAGIRSGAPPLTGVPKWAFLPFIENASSSVCVLPTKRAPASSSRCTVRRRRRLHARQRQQQRITAAGGIAGDVEQVLHREGQAGEGACGGVRDQRSGVGTKRAQGCRAGAWASASAIGSAAASIAARVAAAIGKRGRPGRRAIIGRRNRYEPGRLPMQANRMNPEIDSNYGTEIVLRAEQLAGHSDDPATLTLAYLTRAHQTAGAEIAGWMIEAGMQVRIDAVGNVIGRYAAADPQAPILMTGSHFDTVRAGGRFDGRLASWRRSSSWPTCTDAAERLPFHLDVVAFAEEEGLRFRSSFLASSALAASSTSRGSTRRTPTASPCARRCAAAGLPGTEEAIAAVPSIRAAARLHRGAHRAGAGAARRGLPLASLPRSPATCASASRSAGSPAMPAPRRWRCARRARRRRRDGARGGAALRRTALRGAGAGPHGRHRRRAAGRRQRRAGRCEFSLDVRAADDAIRDEAVADLDAEFARIAHRRGVELSLSQTMRVPCAQCSPRLMDRLADCIDRAGVPVLRLASGAGHDAMVMARITEACMLSSAAATAASATTRWRR